VNSRLFWKSLAVQAAAVLVLFGVLIALPLPDDFFEDYGFIVGPLAWWTSERAKPKNIALHAPVTTSSVHPNSTCSPDGFTDGVTIGSYGVHTDREEMPWVQVDLGDVYRIDTVKIFNRGDGWLKGNLPMTLVFSEDGAAFAPVDTRAESFNQWIPWVYEAGKARARYVPMNPDAPAMTMRSATSARARRRR